MTLDVNLLDESKEELNNGFNYQEIHDKCFVDLSEEIGRQPIALSIGEHTYKGKSYPTPFGSYGDFSCIVGASKSKKTFLKSLFTACYIGGNANNFADKIKGHDTQGKYVIDFDTEQSKYHSQKVFRRVIEMVGAPYKYYITFYLRPLTAAERVNFIDWIFTKSQYKDNIGLCLLDGAVDLLSNANDLEESNMVVQKLLTWTDTSNCHLITVLHRNFGTSKPTGHLGSAILKKAETVLFVEKQDEEVIATSEYTRNIEFQSFKYGVRESDWLPYYIEEYHKPTEATNNNAFNNQK